MSPRRSVAVFGVALLVVFGGVAWISTVALRVDRAELEARHQAAVDENVRLALWRMDSALLPLIVRESARLPSDYRAAGDRPEHVLRLFEIEHDGAIRTLRAEDILQRLHPARAPA